MRSNRRNFILGTGSALVGSALERVRADVLPSPSAPDIRSLLLTAGFDPDSPDSALMAVIGDTHIFLDTTSSKYTDKLEDGLVNELNGLTPAISDLVFAGDLIVSHSDVIGAPRYPNSLPNARAEFRVAKAQMQRFRPGLNVWAVPGNHDTDREEVTPDLWIEELGIPPYRRLDKGGVPVFLLNSGHAGGLDPVQRAWFKTETAQIPTDQEIVIIAHHPTFFHGAQEGALRKIISEVLTGHQAPVWIVGGHGHIFAERLCTDKDSRFIQMEVTAGNSKVGNDGRAPGYILLGLSGGKVACRIFRSLKEASHVVRPPLASLLPGRVEWPFEKVPYPAELFVEGFYDRAGRLISSAAADLKFHFVFTQNITYKIQASRFGGKLSSFLILGQIRSAARPTARCSFSSSGLGGPWIATSITQPSISEVITIPIPTEFRNAETLHVRISTDLPWSQSDMEIVGWGTAASAEDLTGYERWIAGTYRTFLLNEKTDPAAIPAGSSLTNLELFAFNLAPSIVPSSSGSAITTQVLQGKPAYSRILTETSNTFAFARRKSATHPGISAIMEESTNLRDWSVVDPSRLTVTSLDETWEEVRLTQAVSNGYFRVRLETINDPQGTFLPWQNAVTIPGGSPVDKNGNSIDDVMEYGFDLTSSGDIARPYDPARTENPAGQPNIGSRGKMISRIVFARMKASANPGILYRLEQSENLSDWTVVPQGLVTERVLQSDTSWEQIECLVDDTSQPAMYYRVRVELSQPLLQ